MRERFTLTPLRLFHLGLAFVVTVVCLWQHPGLITFDTKLDLQLAPGEFMARATTLWNPDSVFGELQNQASGYLFPLGPFYLLGHLLHVPVWVWERLLGAVMLLAAYDGMRRVARAWGGLGTWVSVLAGLAYMLAPRLISTVGALTGEGLATCVLPWTVLPLVLHLRGRIRLVPAALLSAATVPFMGGHNATEVLAALTFPGVLVLFGPATWRARAALTACWGGFLVLVSLWWLAPLLMLGRYGSPFLSYIESASTTTDRIGWLSALRGTDHWVTFLTSGDNSSWEAGYALASSPTILVFTVISSGLGLLGLLSRSLPRRGVLVAALLASMFALTAGSGGVAGSWLDPWWTAALDGALAPFRNIHKFDPVARMVLAIGLAEAVRVLRARIVPAVVRRRGESWRRPVLAALLVAIAVPVLATGTPALRGELRDDTGFTAIPDSWHDAVDWLEEQDANEPVRALVLPGAGFAIQTWGRTIDEPMQVLSSVPWGARSQTPLVATGTIRVMDAIEDALVSGRPEPQLSAMLGRSGITHVVLRNDLDFAHVDSPHPEFVHRVFDGSAGLLQVAHFGTSETIYPAIEIYAVASPSEDPRVHLFDAREAVTVSGGPEAMRQLLAAQVLDWGKPMLRNTDVGEPVDVVTDTQRRAERNFGRVHFAVSDVMTPEADYRNQRAAHDYRYADQAGETTVAYSGISDVLASSSSGYADAAGAIMPQEGPFAAVDGSLLTSWVTAPFVDPRGSWIELRFDEPTVLGRTSMRFDLTTGAGIRTVRMDTESGSRTLKVDLEGDIKSIPVTTAPTRWARFTITNSNKSIRPVVLNEISIEGVDIDRRLEPTGLATRDSTVLLRGNVQRPACVGFFGGLNCSAGNQLLTTDATGWRARFESDSDTSFLVSGTAVAAGGEDIARLLAPIDPKKASATATSWFGGDPAVVPQNAVDGESSTTWVTAPDDEEPVIDIAWQRPRTITRILPVLAPGTPGTLPSAIEVETDEGTQRVPLTEFSTGTITPVRTDRLRIHLIRAETEDEDEATTPLAVSEFLIDGLKGLHYHAAADLQTGLVCGLGPQIKVGDTTVPTQITGTVGDLISGAPLRVTACGDGAAGIEVDAGEVPVEVTNPGGFEVRDLALTPSLPTVSKEPKGSAEVETWDATERSVAVDVRRDSLLAVTQSVNPGWVATLDGTRLETQEIDGWMQGYVLPAGSKGTVRLVFEPQRAYLAGLIVGLVLAGLVMVAAAVVLVLVLRRPRPLQPALPGPGSRTSLLAVYAALAVLSLPALGGGVLAAMMHRVRRSRVLALLVLALAVATVSGARGLSDSLAAPELANVLTAMALGFVSVAALWPERWDPRRSGPGEDRDD